MARPLRVDLKNGIYHVMTRGIERKVIFREDQDRTHWLNLLAEAHMRFRLRVFAYVLMDNHVHLIVQTPDANLSRTIQWLKVSYSMWFNAKYGRVGPLFQGRFKSVLVDADEGWLLGLSFYVHLNPARLRMYGLDKRSNKLEAQGLRQADASEVRARMEVLRSFRWSSFRYYAGYARSVPDWLDMREVLLRCPEKEPLTFYRNEARRMVSSGHDPEFMDSLKNAMALGGADFLQRVKALGGEPRRDVTGKKQLRARVSWERLIALAEEVRGEPWTDFGFRHGDVGRAVVFRLARQYCGMTLNEIGISAGGVDYAAVSDRIRRYEKLKKSAGMEQRLVQLLKLES